METPSQRLRNGIDGLSNWARMAPPHADECDWGWRYYADEIDNALRDLDREFAALHREIEELRKDHNS